MSYYSAANSGRFDTLRRKMGCTGLNFKMAGNLDHLTSLSSH